jgi:hypothetical protein
MVIRICYWELLERISKLEANRVRVNVLSRCPKMSIRSYDEDTIEIITKYKPNKWM